MIADVDSKARIFQEEIFGPVLAVTKARDFDHAIELANDTRIRPDRRGLFPESRENPPRHAKNFSSAISISIANAPARWSARTRSADSICPAPIRRRAVRIICCNSCKRNRSAKNSPSVLAHVKITTHLAHLMEMARESRIRRFAIRDRSWTGACEGRLDVQSSR